MDSQYWDWFLFSGCVFWKMCSPRRSGLKIRKLFGFDRLYNSFNHVHLQVRFEKHPGCIQTHGRPVLKGPWSVKLALGARGREVGFAGPTRNLATEEISRTYFAVTTGHCGWCDSRFFICTARLSIACSKLQTGMPIYLVHCEAQAGLKAFASIPCYYSPR